MNKYIALLIMLPSIMFGQLVPKYNATTTDCAKITGNYSDFRWKWAGYDSQSNYFWIVNNGVTNSLTNNTVSFKMVRLTETGNVTYVNWTATTITNNLIYFTIPYTNIPPNGEYMCELWAANVGSNITRTLSQGKITVFESLYRDNDGTYPWASGTNMNSYTLLTTFNAHATNVAPNVHGLGSASTNDSDDFYLASNPSGYGVGDAVKASYNNFTSSNRFSGNIRIMGIDTNTIIVSGFGSGSDGTYTNAGVDGGKLRYETAGNIFSISWSGAWLLIDNSQVQTIATSSTDTVFPWEATWSGGTVLPAVMANPAISVINGVAEADNTATSGKEIMNYQTSTNVLLPRAGGTMTAGAVVSMPNGIITNIFNLCTTNSVDAKYFDAHDSAGAILRSVNGTTAIQYGVGGSGAVIFGDGQTWGAGSTVNGNNSYLTNIMCVSGSNFLADGYSLEAGYNGLSISDPVLTYGLDSTGCYADVTIDGVTPIRYWFGGHIVDYGVSQRVRLTAGTSNTPSLNYICAMEQGYITNFTSYPYFPTSGVSRAIMFESFLMDTNSIANGSGYALRSWTDNYANRRGLGRTSWIGERIRRLPAIWESGVQVSMNATNASTNLAYIMTSEGVGWQMHSHTIPANSVQTNMWVINHPAGFRTITNLQQITIDANSNAVLAANSDCFAINVFAFVESGITPKSTRIMLTYSTDDYTGGVPADRLANCIADSSSYDVTGVPVWMQGMTIRIGRIVIRRDSATARTYWVYDRRGQPLGSSGGGSASSGESDPISLHLDGGNAMSGNLNFGGQSGTNAASIQFVTNKVNMTTGAINGTNAVIFTQSGTNFYLLLP